LAILNKKNVRVVHLVRSIGPTSMPWNDLYSPARKLAPGMMYPPVVISFSSNKFNWMACHEKIRKYISRTPVKALFYIRCLYKRNNNDARTLIIHIHNPTISLVGLVLKLLCPKIKIVGNLHTDWSFLRLRHKAGLYLLSNIANYFVAVSYSSRDSIPKKLRIRLENKGRLGVIHNGIDTNRLGQIDMISRVASTEIVAVVVARMVTPKNHSFILQLIADTPEIDKLVWFGDGNLRILIEDEIARLDIQSKVDLRGQRPRSEVLYALMTADLYLSASKWEGIGVANIEAAALGCWPFLSKIPPHDEIASNLGLKTYSLNEKLSWKNGIVEYLSYSKEKRMLMKKLLAEKTRSIFNLETSIVNYVEIYKNIATVKD